MKNRRFAILLLALLPILAGCVRLEGNLTIDADGLTTGKISYALDKSLASQAGITSIDDFKKNAAKENENKVCASESYSENSQELIFECNFVKSDLKSKDSDLTVEKNGNQVTFYFKQTASGDSSMDLGKTSLSINFPGPITAIKENKVGTVVKKSETSALISASGTATLEIVITASTINSSAGITQTTGSFEELFAALTARESLLKSTAANIKKNIKLGMTLDDKVCKVAWTFAPSANFKAQFIQSKGELLAAKKAYQDFMDTSNKWLVSASTCLALIDLALAKQGAAKSNSVDKVSPELLAKVAQISTQVENLSAELGLMVKDCKEVAKLDKEIKGIPAPMKPNLNGDVAQDTALFAQYQSAVKGYEARIIKLRQIAKSSQCAPSKAVSPESTGDSEEVLEGEVIADYEISGKLISASSTRITLTATPNTVVTITASKKGVKNKLSFKVKTDTNGEKVFRTSSNLKGYLLKLFEAGDEVASTTIN